MNTINDRIAFGARLDFSQLPVSKPRWSRIASEFEAKTKKYPNDVFCLNDSGEGIFFRPVYADARIAKMTDSEDFGVIPMDTLNELETFSAKKAADALKRVFVLRKKADSMLTDYYGFENKYNLTEKVKGNFTDNLYGAFTKLREAFVKDRVEEDKVLKTMKNIEII